MRKKRDYEAFLDGYKPALVIEPYRQAYPLVEHYPCVEYDEDNTFHFHTEEQKRAFEEALNEVERGSYEEEFLIGSTLGFPQKSVEFFARGCEIKKETSKMPESLGVIWAGFWFATDAEIVHDEVVWLWNTYKHPRTEGETLYLWGDDIDIDIEVPHGDYNALEKACEYIREKRGIVIAG
ncbi:hypothetical protein MK805_09005 [Shimazuella sp. AN120528]|uniref:hypothetical protein n=1 Tax=Shimazuella soli TaxID=1892854 RepID=UPI001F0DC170|nr:hypothetical protein [Shimazuella soli]MCH5585108.1 hypothetical protein [Shimazuella soli]